MITRLEKATMFATIHDGNFATVHVVYLDPEQSISKKT